jgi:hypothetical protein
VKLFTNAESYLENFVVVVKGETCKKKFHKIYCSVAGMVCSMFVLGYLRYGDMSVGRKAHIESFAHSSV